MRTATVIAALVLLTACGGSQSLELSVDTLLCPDTATLVDASMAAAAQNTAAFNQRVSTCTDLPAGTRVHTVDHDQIVLSTGRQNVNKLQVDSGPHAGQTGWAIPPKVS